MSDVPTRNHDEKGPHVSHPAFYEDETFLITHPWIRHYEQGVPASIDIPELPLTWLLDFASDLYPYHTAFIYYGTKLTYAQFSRSAQRFALELQQMGVRMGDRVAIALPNIPQYPIAFFGTLKAGAVVVPANPLYTEREMQYQLTDSGARVMVVLDLLYPIVRAVRRQTAVERIKDVIITSGFKVFPREVEEVLFHHSAVAEAAVAGVPDAYRGENVAAFVVLKPGVEESENTKKELIQFCKQELTAYKVPKTIVFRTSLPKSLIGKVIRRELLNTK